MLIPCSYPPKETLSLQKLKKIAAITLVKTSIDEILGKMSSLSKNLTVLIEKLCYKWIIFTAILILIERDKINLSKDRGRNIDLGLAVQQTTAKPED
ncbi:MAG: hypothetical protein F6K10_13530 [Moorea sp. SIO2B7]|nr:hypothetical protein [Moorena sp. SIO2B7]